MKKLSLWSPAKPITASQHCKCRWCENGIDPGPEGICAVCHAAFKKLLCSSKWQKIRAYEFNTLESMFCCDPFKLHPVPVKAEEMDHIQPWRFFPSLFWEPENRQPLCSHCHRLKTRQDGSFQARLPPT